MKKKLRQWFESIAFAGLKPGDPSAASVPRQGGFLRRLYDRAAPILFAGLKPDKPAPRSKTGETILEKLESRIEPIVFAGMKPDEPDEAPAPKPAGPLRRLFDRYLSGGYTDDPLLVSNRSWKKRLAIGGAIGIPVLSIVGISVYLMARGEPGKAAAPRELTPAEIAAKTLKLPKDLKVNKNVDLEVLEVEVQNTGGSPVVTGTLHNRSNKAFQSAEISFDLTDSKGSQLGAVEMTLHGIEPNASTKFRLPLQQRETAFVLVRELRGL